DAIEGRRTSDAQYTQARDVPTTVSPSREVPKRNVRDRSRTTRSVSPDGNSSAPRLQSQPLSRDQVDRIRESAAPARTRSSTSSEPARTAPARTNTDNSRSTYTAPADRKSVV